MNEILIKNVLRIIGLTLLQVLVLSRINLSIGAFTFIHVMVYPFALFLLPINTQKAVVLLLGFVSGLFVDTFYNSPGVHATAMLITLYLRPIVLRLLTPYDGYTNKNSPTLVQMGFGWFMAYCSFMIGLFCFIYFSLEAFSFVYFFNIFLNSIFTLIPSLVTFFIIHSIFRSKV